MTCLAEMLPCECDELPGSGNGHAFYCPARHRPVVQPLVCRVERLTALLDRAVDWVARQDEFDEDEIWRRLDDILSDMCQERCAQ